MRERRTVSKNGHHLRQVQDRSGGLHLGRHRAALATLLTVTVLSTGKGRRLNGSYFDLTGIHIGWKTHWPHQRTLKRSGGVTRRVAGASTWVEPPGNGP